MALILKKTRNILFCRMGFILNESEKHVISFKWLRIYMVNSIVESFVSSKTAKRRAGEIKRVK